MRVAARALALVGAIGGFWPATMAADDMAGTEVIDGLEIHQLQSDIKEGNEAHWVVRLDKRPTQTGLEGYRPSSDTEHPLPTTWEPPVEFLWNFGDGTGWISTGERPSIGHRYMELGEYVIEVEARSEAGTVAGELPVEVLDRNYYNPLIRAVEVEPATSTWELTADVFNPSRDAVTVHWDFGDGATDAGPDLWRVQHAFAAGGPREVTVSWTGADGTEASETETWEAEVEAADDELERFDARVVAEGVRTRFEGTWSGGLPAGEMRAEVRPFANLFLSPTSDGVCRFMLTAWDPQQLLRIHMLADLPKLSPGTGRYRVSAPRFTLFADPSPESYLADYRRSGFNETLGALLGGVDFQGVTEGQVNREMRQHDTGAAIGPREEQRIDGGAPAPTSPLVSESEHFTQDGGSIELAVTPHQRVVGLVDVTLEGGTFEDRKACRGNRYAEGTCRPLRFQGRFVLDLRSAPRDGIVRYGGCVDADFAVRGVYGPEPGERHVSSRRPRLGVSFTSDVDPESLDPSTVQLTYPNPDGEPVAVAARVLRDPRAATLKPVDDLWGGVEYTLRVKTGEDGVRGLNGAQLDDGDGSGWRELRHFWTRLDFLPGEGNNENLSCHVHQAVRDAPLLVDRPAVARVYADWRENPRVHPDAQLQKLPARVVLARRYADGGEELTRVEYEFVRPDLAPAFDPHHGDGTALLPFTPDRSTPATLAVTLELDRGTQSNRWYPKHRALCSTPVWKHDPTLRVAFYALDLFDDPTDEDVYARVLRYEEPLGLEYVTIKYRFPVNQEISWSVIPFEEIWEQEEYKDILQTPWDWPERNEEEQAQWSALAAAAWSALRDRHAALADGAGSADLVIGLVPDFAPTEYRSGTPLAFDEEHPGLFMMFLGPVEREDTLPRAARTILHMVGHFFGLEDTPPFAADEMALFVEPPFELHDLVHEPEWHDGVHQSQPVKGTNQWWFWTSDDTDPLVPLMASQEGTEPTYILRHHYLAVQEAIEDNPDMLSP